jgi:hypothetical protein
MKMKSRKVLNLILFQVTNLPHNSPFSIYESLCMGLIEQLAEAALQRDSLRRRSLVQDIFSVPMSIGAQFRA